MLDPLPHHLSHQRVQAERRGDQIADARVLACSLGSQARDVLVPMPTRQKKVRKYDNRRRSAGDTPSQRCGNRRLGQFHVRRLDNRQPGRLGKTSHYVEQHGVAFVAPRAVVDQDYTQSVRVRRQIRLGLRHTFQDSEIISVLIRSLAMSLRRLFHRRRELPFAEYGYEVRDFRLPKDGPLRFADWLHPYNRPVVITQSAVDAVRRFVAPGDFVIDIGAHTGDTTVPMALAAGKTGCTLALEPNPYVYRVLETNARLNQGTTHITPRCCAATADDGQFIFHYSDASFCNGGFKSQQRWRLYRRKYPLTVAGRNLLRLLRSEFAAWLPKLSYIKVDAEGYDRAILASILPILGARRPVIRTEVFRKLLASERYALFDLLSGAGYRIHRYRDAAEPFGESLDRKEMTRYKHFDILAIPTVNRTPVELAA